MKTPKYSFLLCLIVLGAIIGLLVFAARAQNDAAGWLENWDAATSPYFIQLPRGESLVLPNTSDPEAEDGKALELRLAAGSEPSPGNGPEVETHEPLGYGTYSARLKTADCSSQLNAGVVTGY